MAHRISFRRCSFLEGTAQLFLEQLGRFTEIVKQDRNLDDREVAALAVGTNVPDAGPAARTTTGTTPSSENAVRDPMRTIGTRLSRADRIS